MQFPGFKRSIKITTETQALHHIAPCSFPELALLQPQLVLELTKQLAQQSVILQEVPDGYASGLCARLLTAAEQQHSWTISPLPLLAGQNPDRTGSSLCSPYLWGICNFCAACLSSTPRPRPAPSPFLSLQPIFPAFAVNACPQPVQITPARLSTYWQSVCLPRVPTQAVLPSGNSRSFTRLTVFIFSTGAPISPSALLLFSFSYTPQPLTPCVATSQPTLSHKLLTSSSQLTCLPQSQSDPLPAPEVPGCVSPCTRSSAFCSDCSLLSAFRKNKYPSKDRTVYAHPKHLEKSYFWQNNFISVTCATDWRIHSHSGGTQRCRH